jgi:tetratricopeptide (TPR) repeat protein
VEKLALSATCFTMIAPIGRSFRLLSLITMLPVLLVPLVQGQTAAREGSATVEGTVGDSENHPIAAATVILENKEHGQLLVARSDSGGHFHLAAVPVGTYELRAEMPGYQGESQKIAILSQNEVKSVALRLAAARISGPGKDTAPSVEFSDEPQFTVAGLSDPTNLGGHGSDVVLRTKEALAKDTLALKHAGPNQPRSASETTEDTAELHTQLGDIAEREGHPLEAVQEYQRAAGIEPSEPRLFDWGAELLLHRAFEPAAEVFAKGHRLYPRSARTLVGLSVAGYARGSYEQAEQQLAEACDLDPSDPNPYLFLGRLLDAEKIAPPGALDRLRRFVSLHPESALAHYYYAVGLTKQNCGGEDSELIESQLLKAIELDPRLGDAYLQLGICYSEQKDFPKAIFALQKAIETTPLPAEAHFRLAQVYRQTREAGKARREIELYNQISQQRTNRAERERHEIGQFVYTLRGQRAPAQTPALVPQ